MKVTSYYPVIMTERVEETAAFYIEHFGFQQNFASHWYVHLQSAQDSGINLAILDGRHETIPADPVHRAPPPTLGPDEDATMPPSEL